MQPPAPRPSPKPSISISPTRLLRPFRPPSPHSHPPFNVSTFHPYKLFEIRLENDIVVFQGSEHESAAQLLKGVLVLCLQSPLRVEDVNLRLVGTLRHSWTDFGVLGSKINILQQQWASFVNANGTGETLPAGNYEWPFEYLLPGDTAESIEGIAEAYLTYTLKATISRDKFARDIHAHKALRIIRTLSANSLEFMYAMSIENVWLNKVDYEISIPSKAAVFGDAITLKTRFTPLVKGLDMSSITASLLEVRECHIPNLTFPHDKNHRTERIVSTWKIKVTREEDWQSMIEDTIQEGWVVNKRLDLPKQLGQCMQDLNIHGIKVRHKLKVFVPLRNADGHISELAVALPVYIYISPNISLDGQRDLLFPPPRPSSVGTETVVPPGYGDHILDQLYQEIGDENTGIQLQPSSAANLRPDLDLLRPVIHTEQVSTAASLPQQTDHGDTVGSSADQVDLDANALYELNRVPTYRTAIRTTLRPHSQFDNSLLPDYQTAARSGDQNHRE